MLEILEVQLEPIYNSLVQIYITSLMNIIRECHYPYRLCTTDKSRGYLHPQAHAYDVKFGNLSEPTTESVTLELPTVPVSVLQPLTQQALWAIRL